MHTRRDFLLSAVGAAVGAAAVSACGRDRFLPGGEPTTSAPTTALTTTNPPGTTAPTSPTATSAPPTAAPNSAWSQADFEALDRHVAETNGEALMIVEGGITIHEWYRSDESFRRDVASAQKSVLSLLVGRAIGDGLFTIETTIDDVLGAGWAPGIDTATVTVRHLLTMTSGLDDSLSKIAEPDTVWRYSNAFAQLFAVIETTTGRAVDDVAREWLFDPSGASSAAFYDRRNLGAFAPIGLRASARDLAAIGRLVLAERVPALPTAWLDESFTADQPLNASYGYLWWLNGQGSYLLPGRATTPTPGDLIPSAPLDLVAALGKDDQKLYLSRALDLAVVRLGDKADPDSPLALSRFDDDLWQRLIAARG
jgi:CubicO group peptidase (beta-lactamase class C family)